MTSMPGTARNDARSPFLKSSHCLNCLPRFARLDKLSATDCTKSQGYIIGCFPKIVYDDTPPVKLNGCGRLYTGWETTLL
jgi:hypothetical protein